MTCVANHKVEAEAFFCSVVHFGWQCTFRELCTSMSFLDVADLFVALNLVALIDAAQLP